MVPGALLLPTLSYCYFFLPVGYLLAKLTVHALSYLPCSSKDTWGLGPWICYPTLLQSGWHKFRPRLTKHWWLGYCVINPWGNFLPEPKCYLLAEVLPPLEFLFWQIPITQIRFSAPLVATQTSGLPCFHYFWPFSSFHTPSGPRLHSQRWYLVFLHPLLPILAPVV